MRYLHTIVRSGGGAQNFQFYRDALGLMKYVESNTRGRFTLIYLAAADDATRGPTEHAPMPELPAPDSAVW